MIEIRPLARDDIDAVVEIGSRAWAPVHQSIEDALGSDIYGVLVEDADDTQRAAVRSVCEGTDHEVHVAVVDDRPVGFVALDFHGEPVMAEIHMIAVDPAVQRRGVAAALMGAAEREATRRGVTVLMVETGGDPGHAPARSVYASAGYRHVPVARFFKRLG